ncbi:MAG: hypothetical protein BHV74_02795 [Bacteroides finegoldii]|nr:MAG: hypothetical protein BHV74_02795 [Bacteroides finegoldii]
MQKKIEKNIENAEKIESMENVENVENVENAKDANQPDSFIIIRLIHVYMVHHTNLLQHSKIFTHLFNL